MLCCLTADWILRHAREFEPVWHREMSGDACSPQPVPAALGSLPSRGSCNSSGTPCNERHVKFRRHCLRSSVLIRSSTTGMQGRPAGWPSGPVYAPMRPTPPHVVQHPHFVASNLAHAQAIQAVGQAQATAIRLQAEAENQALISKAKAQIEVERMLQEHRSRALDAEAARIERLLESQHKYQQPVSTATVATSPLKTPRLPHVTPIKNTQGLPPASTIKWDLQARSAAKHLREIVADRAPSQAQGLRLWSKMMYMPTGRDKIELQTRIMLRYKAWAHYTEAGFLYHPSCLKAINKELDAHDLEGHLQWVLDN